MVGSSWPSALPGEQRHMFMAPLVAALALVPAQSAPVKAALAAVAAVDGPNAANLVINAARVLAARKPAGAAEALLAYLPFCEDNTSFQECEAALAVVGMAGGKPDPAILKYLKDKNGIRRGTAAQ